MGMILLLFVFGCIDQSQSKENKNETEKVEITKVENVSEIPKPVINISEYENDSQKQYVNYSNYRYKPTLPLNVYFLKASSDELQKDGRAVIIKKGDFDMLIDAGIKESKDTTLTKIASISDDIEVFVISSPKEENLANVKEVIDKIGVGEIWYTQDKKEYKGVLEYAEKKGVSLRRVKEGDVFNFNGIEFRVLNPLANNRFSDPENNAIVMKVVDRKKSILITTDILSGAMGALNSEYGSALKANILEMPSYGERVGQSNTRLFITNVNPDIVIFEGYKPVDIEESPKTASYFLVKDVYKIAYYTVWDNGGVVVSYDGKDLAVTTIKE